VRCHAERKRQRCCQCRPASLERGLASLELVLCLPIILVLAVLALTVVQIGLERIDTQTRARTGAYVQAFDLPPREQRKQGKSSAGVNFVTTMGLREERFGPLDATEAAPTTVIAETNHLARRSLGGWNVTIGSKHAVIAAPIWERQQLPLGYDQYLRSRLKDADYDFGIFSGNASAALPDVFPKAR